jgi:hypothetical protein
MQLKKARAGFFMKNQVRMFRIWYDNSAVTEAKSSFENAPSSVGAFFLF